MLGTRRLCQRRTPVIPGKGMTGVGQYRCRERERTLRVSVLCDGISRYWCATRKISPLAFQRGMAEGMGFEPMNPLLTG